MTDRTQSDAAIAAAFQERYLADKAAGEAQDLDAYLALYPGHEEVVAQLFQGLESGGDAVQLDEQSGLLGRLGPYRIVKELGRGGQGIVYLAEDTRLNRSVALKVLAGGAAMSRSVRDRFLREAETASKLDHPGICSVYEMDEADGIPYIAMRYVEGQSLGRMIAAARNKLEDGDPESVLELPASSTSDSFTEEPSSGSRPASRDEISRILLLIERTARALHVAHESALVHRDIKPGNIMVSTGGEPVILDFGLARDEDSHGATLTRTGELMGTPAYMSPEQLMGGRIKTDRSSDVYSLGVTLFECVTLKRPFEAPTREQLYRKILASEPPKARKLNPRVPKDLQSVLEVALEKASERRYQTAEDLADDLRRVRNFEPIQARPPGPIVRLQRWARRRPAVAALIVVLALGLPSLAALSGYLFANMGDIEAARHQRLVDQVERHLETGFLELGEGSAVKALESFGEALALLPGSVEAVAGAALAQLRLGKPADALAILDRHPEAMRTVPALILVKADAILRSGRSAEAQALIRDFEEPVTAVGNFVAGQREMNSGHHGRESAFAAALDYFHQAVLQARQARQLYLSELAHAAAHAGDKATARRSAAALLREHSDSASARFWAGFSLDLVGDHEAAVAALTEAIRLDSRDTRALKSLGLAFADLKRYDEALAAYDEALAITPKATNIFRLIGNLHIAKGDAKAAFATYRKALAIDPDDGKTHEVIGWALEKQGDDDGALAAYRRAVQCANPRPSTFLSLGQQLTKHGDHDGAVKAHRHALRLDPDYALAYNGLGLALQMLGRREESGKHYEKALSLDPEEHNALYNYGTHLAAQGKWAAAEKHLREAIRLDPERAEAHANLGDVLAAMGRLDEGIASLREAIRLDPDLPEPHYNLAAHLAAKGEDTEAVAELEAAIRCRPDFAEAYCNLGANYRRRGMLGKALTAFRRGHAIGNARKTWPYPSTKWIRTIEKRILKAALEAVSGGRDARAKAAGWLTVLLQGWVDTARRAPLRLREYKAAMDRLAAIRERIESLPSGERKAWSPVWRLVDTLQK